MQAVRGRRPLLCVGWQPTMHSPHCHPLAPPHAQVMPHLKCLVARDIITEALPACRLRLVANHIGPILQ